MVDQMADVVDDIADVVDHMDEVVDHMDDVVDHLNDVVDHMGEVVDHIVIFKYLEADQRSMNSKAWGLSRTHALSSRTLSSLLNIYFFDFIWSTTWLKWSTT